MGYEEAKHGMAKHGITFGGEVAIDVETMMGHKSKAVTGLTKGIEGLFKKNKVTYAKGWGKLLSANEVNVTTEDGSSEVIKTKNVVLATGSVPSALPGVDADEETIVTSTGALELKKVPETMVVIGGGVIGLELGSVWSRLGAKVPWWNLRIKFAAQGSTTRFARRFGARSRSKDSTLSYPLKSPRRSRNRKVESL